MNEQETATPEASSTTATSTQGPGPQGGLRVGRAGHGVSARAMTIRWMSLVPS